MDYLRKNQPLKPLLKVHSTVTSADITNQATFKIYDTDSHPYPLFSSNRENSFIQKAGL